MPRPEAAVTERTWRFEAIGTVWQIDTAVDVGETVRAEVRQRIEAFDQVWSRFRDDSLVAAMGRGAGVWELPSESDDLLTLYDRLRRITRGAVSPLVGHRLADLGYDAAYSLRASGRLRDVPSHDVMRWEPPHLTTHAPVGLDIGAAGKGLLADLVADAVEQRVGPCTVDAGGDIVHRGTAPLRVALEHPTDPSRAIGVVELAPGRALCASAVNRRAWGAGLHHVLDARSGQPTQDVIASWATASSGLLADGAATAAFFVPPAELDPALDVATVRWLAGGRVEWSTAFEGELFR